MPQMMFRRRPAEQQWGETHFNVGEAVPVTKTMLNVPQTQLDDCSKLHVANKVRAFHSHHMLLQQHARDGNMGDLLALSTVELASDASVYGT